MHNFREFPDHRSRIIDVRQRVEVEVFSKIVSALCFTKHVVIRVKNLLMQKLNLIITNHATSSIKWKKKILTHILTAYSVVQKWSSKWNYLRAFVCTRDFWPFFQKKNVLEGTIEIPFGHHKGWLKSFCCHALMNNNWTFLSKNGYKMIWFVSNIISELSDSLKHFWKIRTFSSVVQFSFYAGVNVGRFDQI